jgi:cytochrome c oxidase subunit II
VSPTKPLRLGKAYHALATVHRAIGSVTEIAGLYILLAAGMNIVARAPIGICNILLLARPALVSEMNSRSQFSRVLPSSQRSHYQGGIKLNSVLETAWLFLLSWFAVIGGFARLATTSQADQDVQVIEVTAKKYEYTPSPIRVKQGAKVQLKITALDKTHGFKINLYPDGSDTKGDPGLIFSSNEDCFKIEKGTPTVVQFVARTPGTYSFHCCNRCGIGHGGMKGQLIVER